MALHRQAWRVQVAKLAKLEKFALDLREAERLAFRRLEESDPASPCDPRFLLDHLKELAQRKKDAEIALERQSKTAQEHGRRAKQVEKVYERADRQWRRVEEAGAARQLYDRLFDRDDVSAR
jgi:hypothetical protein